MEGLGDGYEINRSVRQGRTLGGGDEIADLLVETSLGDLLLTSVGGDDGSEVGREGVGCLPAAGGAVLGEVVPCG